MCSSEPPPKQRIASISFSTVLRRQPNWLQQALPVQGAEAWGLTFQFFGVWDKAKCFKVIKGGHKVLPHPHVTVLAIHHPVFKTRRHFICQRSSFMPVVSWVELLPREEIYQAEMKPTHKAPIQLFLCDASVEWRDSLPTLNSFRSPASSDVLRETSFI